MMKIGWLFLVLVVGTISRPVYADPEDAVPLTQVMKWVEQGRILPLQDLLKANQQQINGRILDLEVEQEHDRIVYEIEVLRPGGYIVEIEIDAVSGELIKEDKD